MPVDGPEGYPVRVCRCQRGLLLGLLLPVELPPVHAPLQRLLSISPGLHVRPLRRGRLENLGVRVYQAAGAGRRGGRGSFRATETRELEKYLLRTWVT